MRLLIMGPPGVGKGTQARFISAHFGIPAISTGDIFRANVKNGTPLGQEVQRIMVAGGYVPDEVTCQIVENRLAEPDAGHGFLLDGFPRTIGQVACLDATLDRLGVGLSAVISLIGNQDALVQRVLKRAILEGRPDDNEETIRTRYVVYKEHTDPLLELYADRGLLLEVDGMGSIDQVRDSVIAAINAFVL